MLRHTLSILSATLLIACAGGAEAGRYADVAVVNRTTGETLPVYRHQGRYYVEGRAGDRYAIRLANRSGARILTILSVDGVNAVTGQNAATDQDGYVLSAWSNAEIAGWRKDMDNVAAFYFTALGDSYAARTGRPDNVGVIGVAVYREYVAPVPIAEPAPARSDTWGDAATQESAAPAAAAAGPARRAKALAEEKIGTGHGERLYAPTETTEFRRASQAPAEIIRIYYDSRANLVARGIIPSRPRVPQAFPGNGFVPDPS
ncbi:hypothetical protein EZJ19_02760 [Parasulfuritortus cantonensis]|uniref:Uncharacterized protein n=1 Tax=Parasulfuritortus cantonensis TaxID=2528202 RepID=A0A4R1BLC9_9PROT|nr:hypothetical protein [Parasulfuritortus cantonensis]TCJ18174.1 hypothetical protein EZJ19_02760 [Parasulfuritortus cantonensis]